MSQSRRRSPAPDPSDGTGTIGEPGLDAVLRLLWRRRGWLLTPLLLGLAVAGLAVTVLPPVYSASALVMLDPRKPRVVDGTVPDLAPDPALLNSEIEVLRSPALLEAVIARENLAADPEFSPTDPASAAEPAPTLRTFSEAVKISQQNRSLLISVTVNASAPDKAARLANAIVGEYLDRQAAQREQALTTASRYLEEQLGSLRADVRRTEQAVILFREQHRLGQRGDASALSRERDDLLAHLNTARLNRLAGDNRLSRLLAAERSGTLTDTPEAQASPALQRLRDREADYQRVFADLSERYGPKHPRLRDVSAQIEETRRAQHSEARRLLAGTESEVKGLRAIEAGLLSQIRTLDQKRGEESRALMDLRDLERDAETSRAVYDTFLARLKETASQTGSPLPDSRLISAAIPPDRPAPARRLLILFAGCAGGLLAGIMLAVLRDHLDRRFRHPEDITRKTGRPCAGVLPRLPDLDPSEDLRALRATLLRDGALPPVIAVTSALPAEGKTTLCRHLAATLADFGSRVVVVDADLRRPSLADQFFPTTAITGPALPCVLKGDVRPEEALRATPVRAVSLLAGQEHGPAAGPLLDGPAFAEAIATLRQHFDCVLIDTPPLLPVADTRRIVRHCTTVLMAVQWNRTPAPALLKALSVLDGAEAPTPFMVLTQVDSRRLDSYGYGGAGSTSYAGYYAR